MVPLHFLQLFLSRNNSQITSPIIFLPIGEVSIIEELVMGGETEDVAVEAEVVGADDGLISNRREHLQLFKHPLVGVSGGFRLIPLAGAYFHLLFHNHSSQPHNNSGLCRLNSALKFNKVHWSNQIIKHTLFIILATLLLHGPITSAPITSLDPTPPSSPPPVINEPLSSADSSSFNSPYFTTVSSPLSPNNFTSSATSTHPMVTRARAGIIDLYVVFAVFTALIQVGYMAIVGSFPFNSFLSGVLSCVGTAVLAVCLRIQVNKENKEFKDLPPERAFADFVLCNLVLHLVIMNFLG
ncbi:unnamed protein product [Lactuca virosa]|uniref:Dolichyl-diphosphooligosaccharide--protein glycosyltransferase subunit DAD1 n=1 Tax=Lactuca virosa TaxID=75947 RepID=A0AAU9LKD7_9ASTR|nr:unnamed protein product [Lactuca virosa]